MGTVVINGGTFDRSHFGDVYVDGQIVDDDFGFGRYVERVREALLEQSALYVPLDIEPITMTVNRDLVVAEQSRTALSDAFTRHRHLIILGAAGAGKTSSLRRLACTNDDDLRILIELSRFRRRPGSSDLYALLMLVGEQMMTMARATAAPSVRLLLQLLTTQPVVLLLDGLNEVEPSSRSACLRAIDDLRVQSGCRIVLATREHGLEPPAEWAIVRLCDLNDSQVMEYVRRNARARVSALLEERLSVDDDPLLRVPLFLKYVTDLAGEDGDAAVAIPRSRASIVSRYVRLLHRRERSKLNAVPIDDLLLREILTRLAHRMQTCGQSLPRTEACALVSDLFARNALEASATFERLSAHGILSVSDSHLRFWHHTIQEYFYAESCRSDLFHRGKIDRRLARRLLTPGSDDDALTFITADATDVQIEALLRVASLVNPLLATRLADNLCTDERGAKAVDAFIRTIARGLRNTSWFSRFKEKREPRNLSLWLGFGLLLVFGSCFAVLNGTQMTSAERTVQGFFGLVTIYSMCMLLLYHGCTYAISLAAAVQGVRNHVLRERLEVAFERVARSRLSRKELVAIAESALISSSREDPLTFVEHSRAPLLAIQILGNSHDRRATHALEALVRGGNGNVYSVEALRALVQRGRRYPADNGRAERLARQLFADETLPWIARTRAAAVVKGIAPAFIAETRSKRFARTAMRALSFAALALLCLAVGALWVTIGETITNNRLRLQIALAIVAACILFLHSRSIGATKIVGVDESKSEAASPFGFAGFGLLAGFVFLLVLPVYFRYIPLIKLNARGPGFVTARTIYEELERGEGHRAGS